MAGGGRGVGALGLDVGGGTRGEGRAGEGRETRQGEGGASVRDLTYLRRFDFFLC